MDSVFVRSASKEDVPFITSSWLRSFREGGSFCKRVPNNIYYHYHHKIMEQLLPRSYVLVATNESDPNHILGWLCGEIVDTVPVVHYVYVKAPMRRFGIAKHLFEAFTDTVKGVTGTIPQFYFHTHKTPTSNKMLDDSKWVYHPYLMFMKIPETWYNPDMRKPKE